MITRYYTNLEDILLEGKVMIIYGSRQVGKTPLLNMLLDGTIL
jgi:predicted AAA+ superfamily ATPase